MDTLLPVQLFSQVGQFIVILLLVLSVLAGLSGLVNVVRPSLLPGRFSTVLASLVAVVFLVGFTWICWFHYQVYLHLPLELPEPLWEFLNRKLAMMNKGAEYALPLYDPDAPPRYILPVWLENEKYYFWFMCYSIMALVAHVRLQQPRIRGVIHILLAIQVLILFFAANPFAEPLPKFFDSVGGWFHENLSAAQRFSFFMRLYPKMIFYYNAEYMWFHPPMLFLSYACITLVFVT